MTIDIKKVLAAQYHASLSMLRCAIARCPDELWAEASYTNRFWHIAYHTLFYTHLYLQKDEASFVPWEHARSEYESLGPLPYPPHRMPRIEEPYTKAELLEYWAFCDAIVDDAMKALDLDAEECGFWWYKMSKLEHQLNNIRHIQHHGAQLIDRLRAKANIGVDWVGFTTNRSESTNGVGGFLFT